MGDEIMDVVLAASLLSLWMLGLQADSSWWWFSARGGGGWLHVWKAGG